MKTNYTELLNPPFAESCTREALSSNGTLGKAIQQNCDLSQGQYMVYAPPTLRLSEKRDYTQGSYIDTATTLAYLEKTVVASARKSDEAVLLVYDHLLDSADTPVPRLVGAGRAFLGKELYYRITPAEIGSVVTRATLTWAGDTWLAFGGALGFAKWAPTSPIEPIFLQEKDIIEFSRSVTLFFLNAFDGEGHLIWKLIE